jgi:hypothetical protein
MAFPRNTQQWSIHELSAWRRVALSLPWYGIAVGVVVRAYRWTVLAFVPASAGGLVLVSLVVGLALLCGLATLHLSHFTLRSWRLRAPLLGAFIALGESATSLVLTIAGQERLGRAAAALSDWPSVAFGVLYSRVVVVSLFALALAAAVIVVRKAEMSASG